MLHTYVVKISRLYCNCGHAITSSRHGCCTLIRAPFRESIAWNKRSSSSTPLLSVRFYTIYCCDPEVLSLFCHYRPRKSNISFCVFFIFPFIFVIKYSCCICYTYIGIPFIHTPEWSLPKQHFNHLFVCKQLRQHHFSISFWTYFGNEFCLLPKAEKQYYYSRMK